MNQTDLAFTPALEQAHLIRTGQVSPLELTQLYLDRIESLDSQLGSFVTVTAELAIADAKSKTERLVRVMANDSHDLPPFFGVPIAIKDLTAVQGVRCLYGSLAMAQHISAHDDAVITRLKQAGFVILGKTTVSELGSLPYSEPVGMPPARNPWNLSHTPGGSSGGAAAAVAAGLSPVAQGSDGGGSVRGPAFCCGLVGLKPARGRISAAPLGDHQSGIGTQGILAHTVTDAAALLDVMAGTVTGDPYWLSNPAQPFLQTVLQTVQTPPPPCRIAYSTEIPPIAQADADCAEAVLETARRLENLGHYLEPACPDFTGLVEPFLVVWRAGVSMAGLPPAALSPFNAWLLSQPDSSGDYLRAVATMQILSRQIVAFFQDYDALLLPVYLHPAIQVSEWGNLLPAEALQQIIKWIAPCPPANATGQPAIALPTGLTTQGLPLGIQLVGRPADEATILALAAQLMAAYPWQHRPEFGS
ncbi:MAG: amidase [Pegethrix bostrychoides GSE-TBD4-15B]|jgi:amidase|uniref:Amidase n=1 Tax=Pegethrix bostrychoides GSE-TBD4-15B TaxID=2839662 RepID=A0A951U2S5_9CYAN|nr:amidase [Pegethrix bostrychoides GSE-TBD4-15B]